MNFAEQICAIPIFENVPRPLLAKITADMIRYFSDGEVVMRRSDIARNMIVILEGRVCISVNNILLACREAMEIVGEQAFIDDAPHSADVIAQGFVQILVLPRTLVLELMCDKAFIHNLLRTVSGKLREATDERARHYRREKLLFTEFRAHLSDEVVATLLETGEDYGKPRYIEDAVILFADIRSFSDRSANMSAEDIASQLNPYLESVVEIIHKHGGLVDKFIGDAVMAVWGYTAIDDKAAKAFACAKSMVRRASELHFGGEPIAIGVGLNAGRVFIGNVGCDGKRQFTVLGRPVNLAARYEQKSKELNAPIVIGQAFYDLLPESTQIGMMPHPNQLVKGDAVQTLYTLNQ